MAGRSTTFDNYSKQPEIATIGKSATSKAPSDNFLLLTSVPCITCVTGRERGQGPPVSRILFSIKCLLLGTRASQSLPVATTLADAQAVDERGCADGDF
jgi:hypothetical protein